VFPLFHKLQETRGGVRVTNGMFHEMRVQPCAAVPQRGVLLNKRGVQVTPVVARFYGISWDKHDDPVGKGCFHVHEFWDASLLRKSLQSAFDQRSIINSGEAMIDNDNRDFSLRRNLPSKLEDTLQCGALRFRLDIRVQSAGMYLIPFHTAETKRVGFPKALRHLARIRRHA
jgi:hypothetical protein